MDGLREIPGWKKLALELESGTAEIQQKRKERSQKVTMRRLQKIRENKLALLKEWPKKTGE